MVLMGDVLTDLPAVDNFDEVGVCLLSAATCWMKYAKISSLVHYSLLMNIRSAS